MKDWRSRASLFQDSQRIGLAVVELAVGLGGVEEFLRLAEVEVVFLDAVLRDPGREEVRVDLLALALQERVDEALPVAAVHERLADPDVLHARRGRGVVVDWFGKGATPCRW